MATESSEQGWFSAARCRWILAALTALALAARLATLDFALPFQQEPDAHIVDQVRTLSQPEVSERELYYTAIYPHLIARLALLTGAPAQPAPATASLEQDLAAAGALHLHLRRIVALLSILIVPAAWWIARAFLERKWALFAAALTATSTLALQLGQMARPHAVAAALIALSVAAALRLRRRGDTGSFVLASVVTALAVGCLQNAAAVLLASLAAYLLRNDAKRRWLDVRLLLPLASIAAAIRFLWPFLFVPTPPEQLPSAAAGASDGPWGLVRFALCALCAASGALLLVLQALRPAGGFRRLAPLALLALAAALFWSVSGQTIHMGWQTVDLRDFDGGGVTVVSLTLWFYEPVVLALALAGASAWLTRRARGAAPGDSERRKDFIVVASYALPYLIVLLLFRIVQQRFLLPLIPIFACVAAYGAQQLAQLFARRAASVALVVVALAVPALACGGFVGMRLRPHTLELLAQWMRERNAEAPRRFALHPRWDVPLAREPRNLFDADGRMLRAADGTTPLVADASPWTRYQTLSMGPAWHGERFDIQALYPDRADEARIRADAAGYVAALQADYAILPVADTSRVNPTVAACRQGLLDAGWTSVRRFPDETRPRSAGLDGLDTPHFTRFVLTCRWFGPQLEILARPGLAPQAR